MNPWTPPAVSSSRSEAADTQPTSRLHEQRQHQYWHLQLSDATSLDDLGVHDVRLGHDHCHRDSPRDDGALLHATYEAKGGEGEISRSIKHPNS